MPAGGRVQALPSSPPAVAAGPGRSLPRHIALPPALLTCLLPPRRRRPPTWPQPRRRHRRTPGCSSPCCCSCPRRPPSPAPPPLPGPTWAAASPSASAAPTPSAAVSGGGGDALRSGGTRGGGVTPAQGRPMGSEGVPARCRRSVRPGGRPLPPGSCYGKMCRRRMSAGGISQSPRGFGTERSENRENGKAVPRRGVPLLPTKFSDPHSSFFFKKNYFFPPAKPACAKPAFWVLFVH